jgi:hypothetical protein
MDKIGEDIAVGKLVDFNFKFDVRRDSTMAIKDEARGITALINIKGTKPITEGEYEEMYAVLPPRRVLVVLVKTDSPKMDFFVEGRLNEEKSYIDWDKSTILVTFEGEDGKTYEMCHGILSETAVFSRRDTA